MRCLGVGGGEFVDRAVCDSAVSRDRQGQSLPTSRGQRASHSDVSDVPGVPCARGLVDSVCPHVLDVLCRCLTLFLFLFFVAGIPLPSLFLDLYHRHSHRHLHRPSRHSYCPCPSPCRIAVLLLVQFLLTSCCLLLQF